MGRRTIIYPVIVSDADEVILVDTGFPGSDGIEQIREQAIEAGIPFERLTKVILTHQDIDHIGGLPELIRKQKVKVIAHEEEKPYIEGTKRLIKFTPERVRAIEALPEDEQRRLKSVYEAPPKAPVDTCVGDGHELPCCGGIVVIHTPGHTPGHICLYLRQNKVLIAGDALNMADGSLVGPNPQFSADMDSAKASLKKLTRYDIQTVVTYHGGAYGENVNQRIAELAGG